MSATWQLHWNRWEDVFLTWSSIQSWYLLCAACAPCSPDVCAMNYGRSKKQAFLFVSMKFAHALGLCSQVAGPRHSHCLWAGWCWPLRLRILQQWDNWRNAGHNGSAEFYHHCYAAWKLYWCNRRTRIHHATSANWGGPNIVCWCSRRESVSFECNNLSTWKPQAHGATMCPFFQMPTSCAVEGSFGYIEDAVAFGDVISSHAEIVVKKREVNRE